jgi:hypothetical protein
MQEQQQTACQENVNGGPWRQSGCCQQQQQQRHAGNNNSYKALKHLLFV